MQHCYIVSSTVNCGIQVNFLSLKKITTKLGLTSTVGLKFKPLPHNDQPMEL